MQLKRLWDDRKDLPRAPLPLTSDGRPRRLPHQIIWTAGVSKTFTWRTEGRLNDAGFPGLFCQSAWVTQNANVSIASLCAKSCSWDFARRRLSAQFVLQVRGEREDRWLRWRYKGLTTFCTPFYRFVVFSSLLTQCTRICELLFSGPENRNLRVMNWYASRARSVGKKVLWLQRRVRQQNYQEKWYLILKKQYI